MYHVVLEFIVNVLLFTNFDTSSSVIIRFVGCRHLIFNSMLAYFILVSN